ncbi:MAG: hypothetical protein A2252_01060 [Elusimicrobia bacterium RIFOXYA2_FULL_39_19]|nr:MAG: hypothetical protein A2252_01060 [Elusimicrobia bacterium RIFOXYA2_FULL_39_19]
MKYGNFDQKNKEYVITRQDTPVPWINYIGNDEYCGIVSNTGGGFSFHKDPKLGRLTRYRYNSVPKDRPGRYLYIKDANSQDYWSATYAPVMKDLKKVKYECRHGLGYTKINTEYAKIQTESLYFVPLGKSFEIWKFKITNKDTKKRNLNIFSYAEFSLLNALKDVTVNNIINNGNIEYEKKSNTIYHFTYFDTGVYIGREPFSRKYVYFTGNFMPDSYELQRDEFFGCLGSEEKPQAVENGKCSNKCYRGGNPIASFQKNIALKPGETKTFIFVLGIAEKKFAETREVKEALKEKTAAAYFTALKAYREKQLSAFQVQCPDEGVETITNLWNQYQVDVNFNWARYVSFFQQGIYLGVGFRDRLQDVLGVMHMYDEEVQKKITGLAEIQFSKGDAYHSYNPLTKTPEGTGFSDDPLWLILAVTSYIKETGNTGYLKKDVKFADSGSAPVYDHLKKALDYVFSKTGKYGLPLTGESDWNDDLNPIGPAVSQMVACQFVDACKRFAELAQYIGRKEDAGKYLKLSEIMAERVNKHTWDGQWYKRMFDGKGRPLGSKKNTEAKIFVNAQSWALISGIAPKDRALKAMDSVEKYLYTPYGVELMKPSFSKYDPDIGAIGVVPAGSRENGGIFPHGHVWAIVAECILGRGDTAFKYYQALSPFSKNKIQDIHVCDPYVYPEAIAARENKLFGRASHSWLTGTASWSFLAISQYILGIKPEYNGLKIDPCIPKSWKTYKVTRKFRNAVYEITVNNPQGLCGGVQELVVDGKKVPGNIVPVFKDNKKHTVTACLAGRN